MVNEIKNLIPGQIKVLEALATYKFLTPIHMTHLEIRSDRKNVNKILPGLWNIKKPLIKKLSFSPDSNGRRENFYYLTEHGERYLVNQYDYDERNINRPLGASSHFYNDYKHRWITILFHILLRRWASNNDIEVELFETYFDKIGANRTKQDLGRLTVKTKIFLDNGDSFIPDGIGVLRQSNIRYIFASEVHNGIDTKRFLKHIPMFIEAIQDGSISNKYQVHSDCVFFNIFEDSKCMESVFIRMKNDLKIHEELTPFFRFKTVEELENGFCNDWKFISDKRVSFLPQHCQ